ncbi:hypothetical protein [Parafrankia sp. FMc2]|uniref:hypothetical protein n=1 Tax=Parafrankia sp. FMc2 TaxID=3233196 RepID=UPI0034D56F40
MSTDEHVQHCPACGRDQRFEQPPCADGHGADCPERACVACGHAVFVGLVPAAAPVPVTATAVAPAGTGTRTAA